MHRPRSDIPDFARHLPKFILDPRAVSQPDDDRDPTIGVEEHEADDPLLKLALADVLGGVE